MKKLFAVTFIIAAFFVADCLTYAGSNDSGQIIKSGLLGAGSGLVGGLASGGKGKDVWKGALAGAGVNIVGGALLDSISGEHVERTSNVSPLNSQDAYARGYSEGYSNGYKQGYTTGYRDGVTSDK